LRAMSSNSWRPRGFCASPARSSYRNLSGQGQYKRGSQRQEEQSTPAAALKHWLPLISSECILLDVYSMDVPG
jgi:hypothetical protein